MDKDVMLQQENIILNILNLLDKLYENHGIALTLSGLFHIGVFEIYRNSDTKIKARKAIQYVIDEAVKEVEKNQFNKV